MKRFLHFILFYVLMVSSWADSNGDEGNKFGLCKICGCNFIANEYNVTCTQSVQYDLIFHDEFWIVNGTNETMAYNSVIINNNNFIHFNKVIPKSNLTYLNLAYNSIFNISDSIFRNLQNMRVLILSHNDLEIIHPDTFRGLYLEERLMPLRNLKELRLDYNKIHTLSQDIFEHTTEIEILDVSNNPFEVIDQHTLLAINNLMLLKELYLQYTQIKTLPDNMLHTPKFLRILDLSGNHELEILPETLSQARNLEKLFLNNTGFVNLTKENGFPDMPSLKVLHLCRNEHLHHIDRFALGGLTNLTDLRMSDNIDLISIADLAFAKQSNISGGAIYPPIKKLYLGNNKLSYLESEIIARWDSLSELDIAENPWTCECENQWLIDDLMPIYLKIDEVMAKRVMCAAPIEMKSFSFYDIYMKKSHMRCLDLYGNRPEEDGTMLVGILAVVERNKESRSELDVINEEYRTIVFILILLGVLIAIPAILFLIFAYQKRWFSFIGMIDKSPASYSRRFYSASSTEDF